MRLSHRFFLAIIVSTVFSFQSQSQTSRAKYTDYNRGYYYWHYDKLDSAFFFFNRYVGNAKDSLLKGSAYKHIAEIQGNIGELYGAQESLTAAIQALDPLDTAHHEELGYVYNALGNVSEKLKRYDEAIGFYNKSLSFVNGSEFQLEVMNGKAISLQKKGNYSGAIALYDAILAAHPADASLVARTIDNRATAKWRQNPAEPTLPELWQALQIRADSQYNTGLNASYAHLSDYYAKENPDSAMWYAQRMRQQATQNQSPDDVLEAIDKLIQLTKSPGAKLQWYEAFIKLKDSLQSSRDTTRSRFALIRYDVQKSKADNLLLQQRITRQQLYFYGLLALAVAIIASLYFWYTKRRKRMKQESENAIRNARLKTSQKVHDVVANGLYGIMNELEHRNSVERETLIVKIEDLYEKSRNISHEEMAAVHSTGYDKQVHELLTAYANEHTKVIIVGNQQSFWNNISPAQKQQLHLTLTEMMVNMKKHSHARNVVIQFKQENNSGLILYKDDGVGFEPAFQSGTGLNNTVSRIKSINGQVNFEKSDKGGASIAISFPLLSTNT